MPNHRGARPDLSAGQERLRAIQVALAKGQPPDQADLRWLVNVGLAARRAYVTSRADLELGPSGKVRVGSYQVSQTSIKGLFRALESEGL